MMRNLQLGIVLLALTVLGARAQQGPASDPTRKPPNAAGNSTTQDSPAQEKKRAESSNPVTAPDLTPPRSDDGGDIGGSIDAGEGSSSRGTKIDLSAPGDDDKAHPDSANAVAEAEAAASGGGSVAEFHPWDPHKAAKEVEVGDFYFKRKNYRAAEARYREALLFKEKDAIATLRLAECLENLGEPEEAAADYQGYLKIIPEGPQSEQARKALERLKGSTPRPGSTIR